ncbi:MipA/OmpV family protein [Paucibacter sp. APW11]|uniref:MipA/OmpV family protein n=1 Tax=Roseateles aquae TaxID=3077235 RepID=A0ABU3P7Q2_9BURK|nr:MipA/OmpV family protein [Paucibacter sp. APW11]MDT8998585.1 MipA/OmpV family protein [Paucibacter sp. APW11]
MAACISSAQAQGPAKADDQTHYNVGLGVISHAEYLGSDERRTQLFPYLDIAWSNGFGLGQNGLTYSLSRDPQLSYGFSLGASSDRKEGRAKALKGMGNISSRAEFGGFVNYALSPALSLSSSVKYGSGNDRKGLVWDLGLNYAMQLAPDWQLRLGAGATVANARYMQSYFGVNAAQAASSGYALYTPKAGLRDVHGSAMLMHPISESLSLVGIVSATTLLGDAKSSPLTLKRTELMAGVGVIYSF